MKKYKIKWAGRTRCCCCRRCSPASVHTHPPSFTSASSRLPAPVYLLSFAHSRSPFACSRPLLSFLFTHLPSFVHHCPHPLVALLVTSPLHPSALPILPWPRTPVHQPFVAALARSSMCVRAALVHVVFRTGSGIPAVLPKRVARVFHG